MDWKRFMAVEQLEHTNEDELLQILYKHMFVVAYARTRSRSDALDIVQESWVKILQKINTLKNPEKMIQWAKVIVANTAINHAKRRKLVVIPLIDERITSGELGADLRLVEEESRMALYEGLSNLDEKTRKMLICKFYYTWKDAQIAEVMELPVGTVKARIHRAKAKLKLLLESDT